MTLKGQITENHFRFGVFDLSESSKWPNKGPRWFKVIGGGTVR